MKKENSLAAAIERNRAREAAKGPRVAIVYEPENIEQFKQGDVVTFTCGGHVSSKMIVDGPYGPFLKENTSHYASLYHHGGKRWRLRFPNGSPGYVLAAPSEIRLRQAGDDEAEAKQLAELRKRL